MHFFPSLFSSGLNRRRDLKPNYTNIDGNLALLLAPLLSSRDYKICLVCEAFYETAYNYGFQYEYAYEVFVIDVGTGSDDGRRPGSPTVLRNPIPNEFPVLRNPLFGILNEYPVTMSFFAFDSKMYFLGGYRPHLDEKDEIDSKDVYVYDTSSSDSNIEKSSRMNFTKNAPVIIGPVNEKFYVMSSCLLCHDFEQFDPKLDSWEVPRRLHVPCLPFQGDRNEYKITAHAVVNNEILLSTTKSLYSYHTDSDKWYFYANAASIPFVRGIEQGTRCAVAIGGDRYLGFINGDNKHLALGTYRYNCSDHTWHDFQLIDEWPQNKNYYVYPMSLGDGVVSAVVSGYDRRFPSDDDRDYGRDHGLPITHYISIGLFEDDGPNFKPLDFGLYKDGKNMRQCQRRMTAAFPFPLVSRLLYIAV